MKVIKTMTLTACMLAMTSSLQAQQDPIKIGVVTPLSGTYTGIGQQVRWGLELAAKEINASGGGQTT
jgi:branched-chain amino acid transport system substrate-binding protein